MKQFDFYEFTGILVPGVAALGGIMFLYADLQIAASIKDFNLGGLGVFVMLAYVLGHLVQAIGNGLEWLWWKIWGGMPSDWVRTHPHRLLADLQVSALQDAIGRRLGMGDVSIRDTTAKNWYAITRQIYADIAGAGRAARVDTFNGNYGLNRGIAAALLVVAAAVLLNGSRSLELAVAVLGAFSLALYRMHRFGRHYARELFVQFLQLSRDGEK